VGEDTQQGSGHEQERGRRTRHERAAECYGGESVAARDVRIAASDSLADSDRSSRRDAEWNHEADRGATERDLMGGQSYGIQSAGHDSGGTEGSDLEQDLRCGGKADPEQMRDAAGQVVGTAELQAGRDSMDWAWSLPAVQAAVKHQQVPSAGVTTEGGGAEPRTRTLSFAGLVFDQPVNATTLTVRATPPVGEFVLFGAAAIGTDGSVDQLFGKTKTKYRQVYADAQIRVLENTAAFPRAFVVPSARVAPSLGTALSDMIHQPFQPDQEVILADDTTTQVTGLPGERGGNGLANVTQYSPNEVRVHTSTDGEAWLVLSDTYYPGWTASVDGQPSTVLRGDVLFRIVPVPAGEHDVDFRFEPASVRVGLLISLLSLAIVVASLAIAGRSRWRNRTT